MTRQSICFPDKQEIVFVFVVVVVFYLKKQKKNKNDKSFCQKGKDQQI